MKIKEKIVNVETDEEKIIERDETLAEQKTREYYDKLVADEKSAEQIAAKAKLALLEKLGITEDEARLLLGGN